jgi:DNA-binding GntR family transcriptional regulator
MKTTRTNEAYNKIKEWIIRHRLKPGEHLAIEELAETLNMSRTPVREALHCLEQEHLLVHQPMKGFTVKSLNLSDVKDIFEIRCSLEVLAARQAAKNLSEDHSRRLEAILKEVWEHIQKGEKNQVLALEQEFHIIILEASGNYLLREVGQDILSRIWALQRLNILTSDHLADAHNQHSKVFQALVAGKSRQAAALMRRHLVWAAKYMLGRLRDRHDIIAQVIFLTPQNSPESEIPIYRKEFHGYERRF